MSGAGLLSWLSQYHTCLAVTAHPSTVCHHQPAQQPMRHAQHPSAPLAELKVSMPLSASRGPQVSGGNSRKNQAWGEVTSYGVIDQGLCLPAAVAFMLLVCRSPISPFPHHCLSFLARCHPSPHPSLPAFSAS